MARAPRLNKPTDQPADPQLTASVITPAPEPVAEVTIPVTAISSGLPPIAPLPDVSQEVLDAPRPEAKKSESGEVWDPAIHEDPPRANARGSWARRRGGARRGVDPTAPRANRPIGPAPTAPALTAEESEKKVIETGALCAGLLFMSGEMIVGPCMKPDDGEKEGITQAFTDFCRAYGILEIPPWLGLVGALGLYGVRRWNHVDVIALRKKLSAPKTEQSAPAPANVAK